MMSGFSDSPPQACCRTPNRHAVASRLVNGAVQPYLPILRPLRGARGRGPSGLLTACPDGIGPGATAGSETFCALARRNPHGYESAECAHGCWDG
jgi:hypothetical protein